MATILIVDDRPINRQFLVTLLSYHRHRLLEAADGAEALRQARAESPDLIISDILMPTMDGYEFVRQLRADPVIGHIPVIFNTAHYLGQEASALAQACGVSFILYKPCNPEVVLHTVDTALGLTEPPPPPPSDVFDRAHLRLLTDKLSQQADQLKMTNQKMAALIELGQQLAAERDPWRLLEEYCRAARTIIGGKSAAIGVWDGDEPILRHFYISGVDSETSYRMRFSTPHQGVLGIVLQERRACRQHHLGGDAQALGFPQDFPSVDSFLGVPMVFQERVYGWLYLTNKLGAEAFSEDDEQLAVTLAIQMAVAYENAKLYSEVRRRAAELEQEVAQRRRAEEEKARLLIHEQAARAEAERANRAKDEFLGVVSHELRTPLAPILGWAKMLRTDRLDEATTAQALETIERNAKAQVRLIEDLLDFSKIIKGKLYLDVRPVKLSSIVEAAIDTVGLGRRAGTFDWRAYWILKWGPSPVIRIGCSR